MSCAQAIPLSQWSFAFGGIDCNNTYLRCCIGHDNFLIPFNNVFAVLTFAQTKQAMTKYYQQVDLKYAELGSMQLQNNCIIVVDFRVVLAHRAVMDKNTITVVVRSSYGLLALVFDAMDSLYRYSQQPKKLDKPLLALPYTDAVIDSSPLLYRLDVEGLIQKFAVAGFV